MFAPVARLAARLTAALTRRPRTVRTRHPFRARLGVEGLEAREVPALYSWTSLGGDFDTLSNWTLASTGTTPTHLPVDGDDIAFMSATFGPCFNFHGPGSGSYNSVVINGSYSNTVTLSGGFSTATLTLDSSGAAISQPVSGTDITVTGSFTWTKGTLNSSSHPATVHLTGTALINPTNDGGMALLGNPGPGTVSSGSLLSFENGAVATITTGTLVFTNASTIDVVGSSVVYLQGSRTTNG